MPLGDVWGLALGWLVPAALGAVASWAGAELRHARARHDSDEARQGARDEMMLALGLDRLTEMHERYVASGAGCPVWVKERAEAVYRAYHGLGGNGVGTHLYEEIVGAPVRARDED